MSRRLRGASVAFRPDGRVPRRAKAPRYCKTCGIRVCKYKNPKSVSTECYCCEDKRPWTYALIAGGGTFGEMGNRTDKNHRKVHR